MTRIIPSFVEDDGFNSLSLGAEVFFRRLWNEADDYGRFDARPAILKSRLYPLKDIRLPDISRFLLECEKAGLIACYEVRGAAYLQILRFWFQSLKRTKAKYPKPPEDCFQSESNCFQSESNCFQSESNCFQSESNCLSEEDNDIDNEEEKNKEKVKKESAEEIYAAYPRKVAKPNAIKAILKALCKIASDELLAKTKAYAQAVGEWSDEDKNYIPHPATWFNQERYNDNPETWKRQNNGNRNYIGHTRKDTSNNQGSCNNSADYSRAYLEEY